jgi:uncharacterized protein YecE (DUF72 family)
MAEIVSKNDVYIRSKSGCAIQIRKKRKMYRKNGHPCDLTPGIFIGMSGWHYSSWRGVFFPQDLPAREQLDFYANQFSTIELNGVFYRTPSIEDVKNWVKQTPRSFLFAWKASRFITHWKRLNRTSQNSLQLLESRLRLLGIKAGPVLFQLPPNFRKDTERLGSFIAMLNRRWQYVFEFRHKSWYDDEIFDLLYSNDISLCISDHHEAPSPWLATASFVYVRAYGPEGRYRDHYAPQTLAARARRIRTWNRQDRSVFIYFDNDQKRQPQQTHAV